MNIKKVSAIAMLALCSTSFAFGGGILTNTNQSAHFIRMVARDASVQIDAAYTNPAGLVKLNDGIHFSFSNQSAFQTRSITSTSPIFLMNGGNDVRTFKGTASAPIIPSFQGAYKKGKWVLSGNLAVVGGGGKATFNDGLPSFEAVSGAGTSVIQMAGYKANKYSVDQNMKGSNFIFGGQLGGSYEINEMFSVYAGFRLNVVKNKYEGYLRGLKMNLAPATAPGYSDQLIYGTQIFEAISASPSLKPDQKHLLGILTKASSDEGAQLESTQSGWGVAPILGLNFSHKGLNIGVKYEFKTSLNVENNTKRDDTGLFADGVNTAHDIPALFTIGASYQFTPKLLASVGYHKFFDKQAGMADGKEDYLDHGTLEYLLGLEYQINDMFLVSAGGQITNYGATDQFQKDLSFSCDSYSIGFGGAVNVAKNVKINAGYFWTTYSDYTKEPGGGIGTLVTQKDVFSRTNKVFSAGVDFSF